MIFLAGLLLGVASSGHCAVMCGPLVMAFGRRADLSARASLRHTLTYHAGRLTTYLVAGAGMGLAGQMIGVLGFRQILTVGFGLSLIAGGILDLRSATGAHARWSRLIVPLTLRARAWGRRHFVVGPLLMGAANGLLPCGLLYGALGAAIGLGRLSDALVFMGGFGLGTIPALVVVSSAGSWLPQAMQRRVRGAAPFVLAGIGVLLIARGLSGGHALHQAPDLGAAAAAHVHAGASR